MNPGQVGLVALAPPSSAEEETAVVVECRGVLERHARSFSAAAVFLTPRMRDDAAIAYAFCRLVDDAVDEAESVTAARAELGRIEAMLNWEGDASPIVAAYMALCRRVGVGLSPARDLIKGAQSDLSLVRVEDDDELLLYCYRVAGTVGLMMCGILGVTQEQAQRHAIDLGIGMQLTNICRDVLEDARMGRVYLPRKRLAHYGITAEEVAAVGAGRGVQSTPERVRIGIAQVVEDLLLEADHYYRSGAAGLPHVPRRPRLAITVARALYQEIGVTLRAVDCDPLGGRVSVKPWRKLLLTAQSAASWLFGMFSSAVPARSHPESTRTIQQ